MFLLVPAHPGFPGQIPQSRKTVVLCCVYLNKLNKIIVFEFSNKFRILPCFQNVVAPKTGKVIALQNRLDFFGTFSILQTTLQQQLAKYV